jgi:NADH:ubiquinone oxidoreductase subunit F (NADH-binding)
MPHDRRADVPDLLQQHGGLNPASVRAVSRMTGVPAAEVYGVGSFFHLLNEPDVRLRVCVGLSCRMQGADDVLKAACDAGIETRACSCLAACDLPVAVLRDRKMMHGVVPAAIEKARGDAAAIVAPVSLPGRIGPVDGDEESFGIGLHLPEQPAGEMFAMAQSLGANAVMDEVESSGLQGRGGAGFPAYFKWRAVAKAADPVHYMVLNADEGEPGTFKDREVLLRRPDLVIEGLAIAAWTVGAKDVYCYLRGEFDGPRIALEAAIAKAGDAYGDINFHLHDGQGAYICGEETALLEALEGKQGKPRNKPPYPTDKGLWQKPTLVHNVETIACVPGIVRRGGAWFKALGRTGAGTKLYALSGHVAMPGTYELPLGASLDELVAHAGGYIGELKAFCPGGASSGFLPASERTRPLDFKSLRDLGTFLGSAGVVVLNESVDMAWAARELLAFFEAESCGQCAPCRIGTKMLRVRADTWLEARGAGTKTDALELVDDVAWEMLEGSICGLGHAAAAPLTSAMRYFPDEFDRS